MNINEYKRILMNINDKDEDEDKDEERQDSDDFDGEVTPNESKELKVFMNRYRLIKISKSY